MTGLGLFFNSNNLLDSRTLSIYSDADQTIRIGGECVKGSKPGVRGGVVTAGIWYQKI